MVLFQFLICIFIYVGLWKWVKVPTNPVNALSIIHASSSIVLYWVQLYDLQMLQSIAYFIVDTFQTDFWIWRIHHTFAVILQSLFVYKQSEMNLAGSYFLYWSEIGGILYHISRMFPKNQHVRMTFLISYFLSRIMLLYSTSFVFSTLYVFAMQSPLLIQIHVICSALIGNLILVLNAWFLKKQVDLYKKDFLLEKKNE